MEEKETAKITVKKGKGMSCLWIVAIPLLMLVVVFVAVVVEPPDPPMPIPTPEVVEEPAAASEPIDEQPYSTPEYLEDKPDRYNFVALGGDWREHRAGTKWGNKTDVFIIVSIYMTDPVEITLIQLPRNLYVETGLGDRWAFAIYGEYGFEGIHKYVADVFGIPIHGVGYIHMDNFVDLVDGLGGLWIKHEYPPASYVFDGEMVLAYLRDNENNWEFGVYDAGFRQFTVLEAVASKFKTLLHEDPLTSAQLLWNGYYQYFKTDLDVFEQLHYLVELGWTIATMEYDVVKVRLWEPAIVYGDVPLEVRGWSEVQPGYLKIWIQEVFNREITN